MSYRLPHYIRLLFPLANIRQSFTRDRQVTYCRHLLLMPMTNFRAPEGGLGLIVLCFTEQCMNRTSLRPVQKKLREAEGAVSSEFQGGSCVSMLLGDANAASSARVSTGC